MKDYCEDAECICLLGLPKSHKRIIIVKVINDIGNSGKLLFIDPEELKEDRRIQIENIINGINRRDLHCKLQCSIICCTFWKEYLNNLHMNDLKRVDCVFKLDNYIVFTENEILTDNDLKRLISIFLSKLLPKFLTTLYMIDIRYKTLKKSQNRIYFVMIYYVTDLLKEKMFNLYKIISDICKSSKICDIDIKDIDIVQMIISARLSLERFHLVVNILFKFVRDSDIEYIRILPSKLDYINC